MSVKRQDTLRHLTANALRKGLISYVVVLGIQFHGVKRLSPKKEAFAVNSHSKLNPIYQYDLLYVSLRVIYSTHNRVSSWFTSGKTTPHTYTHTHTQKKPQTKKQQQLNK